MSSDSPPNTRRRKQRVDVACDFCRRRKLGCDNAKPKCENCFEHQKDCTYAVRTRKDRPSNTRINILRDENYRLREELERLRSTSALEQSTAYKSHNAATPTTPAPAGSQDNIAPSIQVSSTPQTSQQDQNVHRSTRIDTSAESHGTQFHGPTSAMFDGGNPLKIRGTGSSVVVDASQKVQLLAEAARQRQLELVNLRSGRLNFDGLDPEHGMSLLSIFWNRQHATGSVVYRPCFMRDMAGSGPYYSPLLLNAIFFVASKHSPEFESSCTSGDKFSAGLPFRQKVEGLLHHPEARVLCKSSITAVQALLLMSDALFSWCDERSLSWHYLGIAINMIIDLGIHAEGSTHATAKFHSAEDKETHRRVFWAAFVLDKVQSIYQGRPARLRDMDSSVPMVFLDEYEELEPFDSVGYSKTPCGTGFPTHSVTTFEHLCKLSTIADSILCSLYVEKSSQSDPQGLFQASKALHADLVQWRESLPAHLSITFDTWGNPDVSRGCVALPHTLSLILMYYALLILLHRPFVSEGHLKSAAESATRDALSISENAASEIDIILRWYKDHWCIKSPPYFVSYSTYVSATIHVRTAALKPPGSNAHRGLQNCLEILSEHQIVCHAPRRSMGILLGLVERLKVDVGREFSASISRTAHCEASRLEDDRQAPVAVSDPALLRRPAKNMLTNHLGTPSITGNIGSVDRAARNPVQPLNERMEPGEITSIALEPEELANHGSELPLGSYALGELLPVMYFDLDPLFGFNDFQMDLDVNL